MDSKSDSPGNPEPMQAYVKLMTEHQGNLRALIVTLMPGSPDVADVLQETNLALWQKRDRFEIGTNFLAWAFKFARIEVMHQRDRNKRSGRLRFSKELVEVLADSAAPADESDEELMAALDNCLEKLSDRQREIVVNRYTPGKSLEQFAATSGSTAGSLRIALHRIRAELKQCVEERIATDR